MYEFKQTEFTKVETEAPLVFLWKKKARFRR